MRGSAAVAGPLLVGALLLAACGSSGSSASSDTNELPDVELARLDGSGEYAIAGPGEDRVLNLWATWCAPCRAELPAFDRVAAEVEGVDIVGVNVGDTGDDAAALVDELDLEFAQVLDPRAEVQRALRITGMPSTIFVDDRGQILQVHNGELTEGELRGLLRDHYGLELDLE